MKFISICSGIEAASVAFNAIGWKAVAFSEIEPFPCSLLAHHYPDTPNFGDMTKFREWPEEVFVQADMIVGGPPCQSFSVAGKREGLDDERGNLTLIYTELIDHADTIRRKHGKPPAVILYENVPGLLSDKTGAFGCFLAALAGEDEELQPTGKRWSDAGVVLGPQRAVAWRILDAQYFGLAQRRRRVFVVASARAGFDPAEVLFEFDGVRRDIAPSRESGQEVAGNAGASAEKSNEWPAKIASTLNAAFGSKLGLENQHINGGAPLFVPAQAFGVPGNWVGRKPENGGNSTRFMPEVAPSQTAMDRHAVITFQCTDESRCTVPPLGFTSSSFAQYKEGVGTLRANGGDLGGGSETLVLNKKPVAFAQNTRNEVRLIGGKGDIAGALAAQSGMKQTTYIANIPSDALSTEERELLSSEGKEAVIAFNSRQDPVSGDVFGALDTSSPQAQAVAYGCTPTKLNDVVNTITASYGQGGVDLETKPLALVTAIADDVTPKTSEEIGFTLSATDYKCPQAIAIQGSMIGRKPENGPQGSGHDDTGVCFTQTAIDRHAVATQTAVRRLTPVECERLQGFPDSLTEIPWRNKPADQCPDGHRYKALGNSMAVPVMRWIGERIDRHLDGLI